MNRHPDAKLSRRKVLIAGGITASGLVASGLAVKRLSVNGLGAAVTSGLAGVSHVTSERRGIGFGTIVSLKASHKNPRTLDAALDAAWTEIVQVEEAASLFRGDSALCRLNRDGIVRNPPGRLVEMLKEALAISEITDGAFDPTVQPLWRVYDDAYTAGRYAGSDEIKRASALIGWRGVIASADEIRFNRPGMALTLNGIAQGFATGRCLDVLREHGIENAFIDTGEIGAAGSRGGEQGKDSDWTVSIADPRKPDEAMGIAKPLHGILATSGDYATVWSNDYSHHHILDPATLRSPIVTASVSVLAQSGGWADGLATAMMVMGPENSLRLANRLTGVEALIITKSGARYATDGFPLA
jgi:FAD:protein FMN transferase